MEREYFFVLIKYFCVDIIFCLHFRKFYFLDREKSVSDPETTFITVPNVPYLTGMRKIRHRVFQS